MTSTLSHSTPRRERQVQRGQNWFSVGRLVSTDTGLGVARAVASIVLITIGVGAIVMGINARSMVHDNLAAQKITGMPYMTPAATTARVKLAGLNVADTPIPTCSVANQPIVTGSAARCFAQYMNDDALEITHGRLYSQMPVFVDTQGTTTDNPALAAIDPRTGQPVLNPARDIWVTETALTTALNTSYMADQVALFGIVVGIALILAGLGFATLSLAGALRNPDSVLGSVLGRAHTNGRPSPGQLPGAPAIAS